MAEDLTEYYSDLGLRIRYLHSDITTLERMDIIRDLRLGQFDVLVGINLLREGLDIPEVSLVAILDADKEGFLRSTRSLIQTCGRAARNANGMVILYADTVTPSMQQTLDETNRRRRIQHAYNQTHGITPTSVHKAIAGAFDFAAGQPPAPVDRIGETPAAYDSLDDVDAEIRRLDEQMHQAAKELDFERAADLRDRIRRLQQRVVLET
jgi:excinuclease ABC subunit B